MRQISVESITTDVRKYSFYYRTVDHDFLKDFPGVHCYKEALWADFLMDQKIKGA